MDRASRRATGRSRRRPGQGSRLAVRRPAERWGRGLPSSGQRPGKRDHAAAVAAARGTRPTYAGAGPSASRATTGSSLAGPMSRSSGRARRTGTGRSGRLTAISTPHRPGERCRRSTRRRSAATPTGSPGCSSRGHVRTVVSSTRLTVANPRPSSMGTAVADRTPASVLSATSTSPSRSEMRCRRDCSAMNATSSPGSPSLSPKTYGENPEPTSSSVNAGWPEAGLRPAQDARLRRERGLPQRRKAAREEELIGGVAVQVDREDGVRDSGPHRRPGRASTRRRMPRRRGRRGSSRPRGPAPRTAAGARGSRAGTPSIRRATSTLGDPEYTSSPGRVACRDGATVIASKTRARVTVAVDAPGLEH